MTTTQHYADIEVIRNQIANLHVRLNQDITNGGALASAQIACGNDVEFAQARGAFDTALALAHESLDRADFALGVMSAVVLSKMS